MISGIGRAINGYFNRPCPQRGDGYREDMALTMPTLGYLMLVDMDVSNYRTGKKLLHQKHYKRDTEGMRSEDGDTRITSWGKYSF